MYIDTQEINFNSKQSQQEQHTKMKGFKVFKRDGRIEDMTVEKIHKVCSFACQGIDGVSVSELEMKIYPHLRDGMTTDEISEQVITAARDLVVAPTYNYDMVGGRMISYVVRKQAYGTYQPWHIKDIIARGVANGRYDPELSSFYSESEWDLINTMIDHSRDDGFRLAGADQMRKKYLVKHRVTGEIFESFQIPYILVGAVLFRKYPKNIRLNYVKKFYDYTSLNYISLPTPIMSGLRTRTKQFSSCVVIDAADDLESIGAADLAALRYVSVKAGLGMNAGRNRGLGAPIRQGDAYHTGLVPFLKKWTATIKSCSQGGVRDGSVTTYFPMWHYEFPELVVLKDNALTEERTNRSSDYGVQINKYLLTRLIKGQQITLFSPAEVPGLYEAFFADQAEFARLYEQYEKDVTIRRRSFAASELFNDLVIQRMNTGRIYLMFVDTVNEHSSFKVPIYMSNLCCEIALPTKPLRHIEDEEGEISLCTLAATNMGKIDKLAQLEDIADITVRALNEVLDYQDYPVKAAYNSTMKRRPLGVGLIGLAHFLAKKGFGYNRLALNAVDEFAEAWSYYLIKASVNLAREQGPCPGWKETKYSDGWTPNLTHSAELDKLLPHKERLDWEGLRRDLKEYGIRNSTLMACMPSETSSQLSNETNGIEPPRSPIVTKSMPQVVPDVAELGFLYDWVWNQKTPDGYLEITAVIQKYVDQAMSINTSYNPLHFPNEQIGTKQLLKDILYAYKLGHKTLYYCNTKKPGEEEILGIMNTGQGEDGCASGACMI
jgi:ribonucleoside-diphosphate reductase alpha chain